jgi:nucleoside-diphosphate-sugar epimerase
VTILVTGSAGHLGEALVRTLRATGTPVRGLDLKPSETTDMLGSVCDCTLVREAMSGVTAVVNTATLHKPHVVTHTRQQFVDTNVTGTLTLLEEATRSGVEAFVQTSTTSVFGDALTPGPNRPAVWITEEVAAVPKNIYGATKLAAEHLCRVVARKDRLPLVILRTARFFPEEDDNAVVRSQYSLLNVQSLELLYRRADIADVASAHLAAIERAREIEFGMFIISATTPFTSGDLEGLGRDAPSVLWRRFPKGRELFERQGWSVFPALDRVYVNARARRELKWQPRYDFQHVLECLGAGKEFRSKLALDVGAKGYHDQAFEEGPYPV